MAKFHSPHPSSGEELSPSVRSVKHASNHPRMTRQSVASHRLSPDVTAAPTPDPHLGKTPARPSSSKKAAATRASTSAASTNADCPELFKDDTTASASNHPRRYLHQHVASTSAALRPPSPFPHSSTQTPQRSSHSFHFRGPTPMFGKGAGTRHLRGHVNFYQVKPYPHYTGKVTQLDALTRQTLPQLLFSSF
ncbi:hypothetical protein GWK47_032074 [Chionoecetes opilio]|uniref:Uncharacterized protein n=1 Tax=Chionoecetes opilio TaxID=41210 RepID=A0A8J4YUQ6_CHIOP|nr:hypothetical protein GWK47_032074 [Chionoecetes opilio]